MGERSLIAAIEATLGSSPGPRVLRWIGDDCAVVRGGGYAAVSVDVMVDGTHFRLGDVTAADAGHRALAGALSDLAAMGAEPGEAYLAVVLPHGMADAEALELHRAAAVARRPLRRDRGRRRPCARPGADDRRDRDGLGGRGSRADRPRRRARR